MAAAEGINNFSTDAQLIISEVTSVIANWEAYTSEAEVLPRLQKLIKGNLRLKL